VGKRKKKARKSSKHAQKAFNDKRRKEQRKTVDGIQTAMAEIELHSLYRTDKAQQLLGQRMWEAAEGYLKGEGDDNNR
jgi:hypothetical protein